MKANHEQTDSCSRSQQSAMKQNRSVAVISVDEVSVIADLQQETWP
jgi:hypothetical protein